MKKLISTIILTVLLFSCLSLTAFAGSSVTISDDYQTLTMDGITYSRVDASILDVNSYEVLYNQPVEFSTTQKETLKEVSLETNDNHNLIFAEIKFKDGAYLSVAFLRNEYLEAYNQLLNGQTDNYIIDFEWPAGNTVNVAKNDLFGESINITSSILNYCDFYYTKAQNDDGVLSVLTGVMISHNDNYFYVDYSENSITDGYEFESHSYGQLSAHKITNKTLISDIEAAEAKYYGDDLGYLYDDDLSDTISAILLTFLFAVVPFVLMILFIILAIRSKTIYKKLFRTIYILSASVLVVFTLVTLLIF